MSFYGIKLIDVFLNLQSKSAQNMVGLLLSEKQYLRLNFESDKKLSLDDVKSIDDLKARADKEFSYNINQIKDFLESFNGG